MVERFNLTTIGETKIETALDKEDLQKIVSDKEKTEISKDIQEKKFHPYGRWTPSFLTI